MRHDARIDVCGDDFEVVQAGQVVGDERIHDRPRLIALRRSNFEQACSRRQVQTGSDDEHFPDALFGRERLDDAEPDGNDVARFDGRVSAEAARTVELGDASAGLSDRWATNSF